MYKMASFFDANNGINGRQAQTHKSQKVVIEPNAFVAAMANLSLNEIFFGFSGSSSLFGVSFINPDSNLLIRL